MSVGDARINTGLPSHPKTVKLERRLGEAGCYRLICLFLWTAANRTDGDLSGMTKEDIEIAAGWRGTADQFVDALVAVGFLDGREGEYLIHDWADHNPWAASAGDRSLRSSWLAYKRHHGEAAADARYPEYAALRNASRSDSNAQRNADRNAPRMPGAAKNDAPSPPPLPSPPPTDISTPNGVDPPNSEEPDGSGETSGLFGAQPRKGPTPCPHQEIIDLYLELLPMGRAVRVWTGTRAQHLQARWRESAEHQTIDFWRELFEYCAKSKFLTGRAKSNGDRKPFQVSLDWIVKPDNFAKIIEGAYHESR